MSRNHLKFVRDAGSGKGEDWRQISWSVLDLGGMCGTYINKIKIEAKKPHVLNDGDMIGVGCPEEKSSRTEKLEKFVFKIRAPEAYRAPLMEAEIDDDCPTPPPLEEEEEMEVANVVKLPDVVPVPEDKSLQENLIIPEIHHESPSSEEVPEKKAHSDESSPVVSSLKKRRLKRLLSSSEDDDDEVKKIKKSAKRKKNNVNPETFDPIKMGAVSVKIPILKMPKRSVTALIGSKDNVLKWKTVSCREYKRITRTWAGLNPDGSQGTPLLQSLDQSDSDNDNGLSDVSSVEIPGTSDTEEGEIKDMELSVISSDEELVKSSTKTNNSGSSLVKVKYGANLDSKPLIVKAEIIDQPREAPSMNYSMNDDAAVITLLDSEDEEEYNQSQNLMLDDAVDTNSDRDSPVNTMDQDAYKSEGDLSDILNSDSEQDDDEIQILNDSQTSLFNKIYNKVAVKPEPTDDDVNKEKMQFDDEKFRKELLESLDVATKISESSLDEDNLGNLDKHLADNIVEHVQGADKPMVFKIYKRLSSQINSNPTSQDLLYEVVQECERILVMKLAIQHKMPQRLVKLALLELKGEDRDTKVLEQDLDRSVFLKKHQVLLDEVGKEFHYSQASLKHALFILRDKNEDISKENLVSYVPDQDVIGTDVDGFEVNEKQKANVNDINLAGPTILDTLEDDVPLEPEVIFSDIQKTRSPETMNDDSVDDLLKDDDDEVETRSLPHAAQEKPLPSPNKLSSKAKSERGPQIIQPPKIPSGRGHLRGVLAEPIKTPKDDKCKEASPKASRTADLKKVKDPAPKPGHSNEEFKAKRVEKLKQLNEDKEIVPSKRVTSSSCVGVMKNSVPRSHKLLIEMQESGTPVPRRKSDLAKDPISKHRERKTSVSETSSQGRTRRSSGNFLEAEEAADFEKKDKSKREKYASTGDGYKAIKKMSVHNVDYNIMSQDISKLPVRAKPLKYPGIFPEPPQESTLKIKKKVRWRDENGMENLSDTKFIEANNRGLKCGPGNKDLMTPVSVGREGNKRKPNKDIDMSNIFKVILEWNCAWPIEQKKSQNKEPPPVHGSYKLLPLLSSFSNLPEYQQIFLPLMFHELYSSIYEEYDENMDSIPVFVQEVAKDTTQLFTIIRCISLQTDQVNSLQVAFNQIQNNLFLSGVQERHRLGRSSHRAKVELHKWECD